MNLREYLFKNNKPGPFQVSPFYLAVGDFLTVYFRDDPCVAENVTPDVVVYKNEYGGIVGVKIHGIDKMIADAKAAALLTKTAREGSE